VNELLPLVDAIRKAVYNRAVYLEVLQSPLTLTPSLLGHEISPLPGLSALSFLPESEFGIDSGAEDDDEDADATKEDKERTRGRGERKGKVLQQGGNSTSRQGGNSTSRQGGNSTSRQGGNSTSRRSQAGSTEPADNEDEDKEKATGKKRKSVKPGTTSPLPPLVPGSAPGSAARTCRMPTKRERAFPFTQAVARIIRQCRKDAQHLCEEYYRTKGERQVTRPNRIPISLPLLLQSLEEGFTQHEQSTAAHRTISVKQFHAQLATACAHLCAAPRNIFQVMTSAVHTQCRAHQDQMESDFARKKSSWKLEREKLHNSIRPQVFPLSNQFFPPLLFSSPSSSHLFIL
jgi:hypothetical protein